MRSQSVVRSSIGAVCAAVLVLTGAGVASADPLLEFTDVGVPTILGAVVVGSTLSIHLDEPTPTPDFVDVEWSDGTTVVKTVHAAATEESIDLGYTVTPAVVGKHLQVHITLSKDGYADAETDSLATAAVAPGTQSFTPKISGAAAVGTTLKVSGLAPGAASTYQWKRNGASISGARSSTYKQTSSDVGKKISVTVTAKRAGYTTLVKTSASTATVRKSFAATHTPKITGTAKVGYTLRATTSAWSPAATLKYQWYRDGVAISGATSTSRKLSGSDAGKKITVKVTGSRSGYYPLAKTSAATAVVSKGSITALTPKITGTAKAGYILTASIGTVSPSTVTKTYQWYANGVAVVGKTASTYTLFNVDAGKKFTVKVTYSLAGYTTRALLSASTATVAKRSTSMANNKEYSPAHPTKTYPDLAAGVYIADNASESCQWVRDTDHNPDNGEIAFYEGPARWMVQIYNTDGAFWSSGCGSWIKYDGTGAKATTISKDGMYRIGVDIKPGLYEQSGTIDNCYVTLESNASNEESAIIADESSVEGAIITLDPDDAPYFTTWRCGTWTWIGGVPTVG